ncbi:hypothetical protein GCM10023108_09730 [Saccharopolyspora hordei]
MRRRVFVLLNPDQEPRGRPKRYFRSRSVPTRGHPVDLPNHDALMTGAGVACGIHPSGGAGWRRSRDRRALAAATPIGWRRNVIVVRRWIVVDWSSGELGRGASGE